MQKLTAAVAFLGAANAYTLPTNVYSRTSMRSSSRICMDEVVPMNPTWKCVLALIPLLAWQAGA